MHNDIYILYSGATDATGQKLAEKLDIAHGKTMPKPGVKVLIGWGAKLDKAVTIPSGMVVLNHPNAILGNRNKFSALQLLAKANVAVAPFVEAGEALKEIAKPVGKITLPCIGRTHYHQGGAGFFTCLTATHVRKAIEEFGKMDKRGYFQNYIDVETEYRLHIFDGKCITGAKKVERTDVEEAHIEQQKEKILASATKKGEKLDDKTLTAALKYQAGKINGPDQIIKSNTRGWKFVPLKDASIPKSLLDEAIKAVNALGLTFGAVDCVMDVNKKAWVIEVNSGPGLEGTAFDAYVNAFVAKLKEVTAPKTAAKTAAAAPKMAETQKKTTASDTEDINPEALRTLASLLEKANDTERRAINSAARKLFS